MQVGQKIKLLVDHSNKPRIVIVDAGKIRQKQF